jgi:hypothetical protein
VIRWQRKDKFFMSLFHVTEFERRSGAVKAESPSLLGKLVVTQILLSPIRNLESLRIRIAIYLRYFSGVILYLVFDLLSIKPTGYFLMSSEEQAGFILFKSWAQFCLVAIPLILWAATNEYRFSSEIRLRSQRKMSLAQVEAKRKSARRTLGKIMVAALAFLVVGFLPGLLWE